MWAMGDYPAVAADVIPDLGALLVEACQIRAGHEVLDVACGAGNAAIPAAERGATVTACDLTPELLEAGRHAAASTGAAVTWREADAESLPFADGSFDVVMSCVGVMFAPDHRACAAELARVCRRGGTIGLASWTPQGFVGEMFAAMRPYAPPPPPGALPPPLWGDEQHVRGLFGDTVTGVSASRRAVTVDGFETPEAFCDYFTANYGPTVAACRGLAGEPDRLAALHEDLRFLARRHDRGTGSTVMDWEYLLLSATRAG
ncbi:MAG: class I SAM-dependent methyltransferase [Acidimicrobiales bacterium]